MNLQWTSRRPVGSHRKFMSGSSVTLSNPPCHATENPLNDLHDDIEARVISIRAQHADWPCSKGCDHCCRHLAEVPQLTAGEWSLLETGLAALPPDILRVINARIAMLNDRKSGPVVCPMLDPDRGACLVYQQRPVACRTYGFYVQRNLGLYCHDIETRVSGGELADVVWGNHDAIERRLTSLGETRPLNEWVATRSTA
jgi:Fe-S-cluster containining protein